MELDTTERPTLTRFERARCIGARATQLAKEGGSVAGALDTADQLALATAEMVAGNCPLVVQRVDNTVDMRDAVEVRADQAMRNEILERAITKQACLANRGASP